jgi:DNA-binding GntR family transcriptional regulator
MISDSDILLIYQIGAEPVNGPMVMENRKEGDGSGVSRGDGGPAAAAAYHALERLIVTLGLAPGAAVSESGLVALTGFGRTPVREALQRLAWEGFVAIRPRSGATIAPINPSDWVKVIDARRGAETVLARSAAQLAGEADLTRFRRAAAAMARAAEAGDVTGFLDADKAFDEALAAAADNDFAARLAAPLKTHGRRFWFRYRGAGGLAEAAESHVGLIGAIVAGDPRHAESEAGRLMDALREHAVKVAVG